MPDTRRTWTRRRFLETSLLSIALPSLASAVEGGARRIVRHPRPGEPGWPSHEATARLGAFSPSPPEAVVNPFALQDQPGATQSRGWLGAWESMPSALVVAARGAADVQRAVDFARTHSLRLVVKGTGHDYLGRSNGADSLLVWTHPMRAVEVHQAFVPQGAPGGTAPQGAISVGAGTRWIEAYLALTRHGRYVQGGGCTSVGAAGGFIQGGGFGSFSRKFGTGAAGVLEAEVVTADGRLFTVNAWQHPDLFWALRGGGGATFGIVTRMTLMTHPLPSTFGAVFGTLRAASDEDFRKLVERFCAFFRSKLDNEHWGESFVVRPDNTITLAMTFQGLEQRQVEELWAPLGGQLQIVAFPAGKMWDAGFLNQLAPGVITKDPTDPGRFWWTTNTEEVLTHWYTYQSRYVPAAALAAPLFLYEASRHWPVALHVNKGLSGCAAEARRRCDETAMNPVVYDAAALAILSSGAPAGERPQPGDSIERIGRAMAILRQATPQSGTYPNEADYFEPDWQRSFWGVHYSRLLRIKESYDPLGLFHCHHGVGSEGWSRDQMTRS